MATPSKDQLIRFRCACGKKLKASRDLVGRKVQCAGCDRVHRVPKFDQLRAATGKTLKSADEPTPSNKTSSTQSDSPKTNAAKASKNTSEKQASGFYIHDDLAAKEPSLLPGSDDSDSRFRLDPKTDSEPSEESLASDSSFEFDLDDLDMGTDLPKPNQELRRAKTTPRTTQKAATSTSSTRPRKQRSISTTTILASLAVVLSLIIIGVLGWSALSNSSYPAEFSERPEVKNYVAKIQEFRNIQRELEIVSDAYVKSKSPPPEEREQIEAFNRSIKPLIDKDIKLTEALKLFKASQVDEAKATLVAATTTLHQKIPELQSRAKDFASKLR